MRTQHWAHRVDRTRLTSAYDDFYSSFSLLLSGTLTRVYIYLRPSAFCTVHLRPRPSSCICAERRWNVGMAQVRPYHGYPGWKCEWSSMRTEVTSIADSKVNT